MPCDPGWVGSSLTEVAEPDPLAENPAPARKGVARLPAPRQHVRVGLRGVGRSLTRWVLAALVGVALGTASGMVFLLLATLLLPALAGALGAIAALGGSSVDPIYTRAALGTLADVQVEGIAVAGPPGDALHALAPDVFVTSTRANGVLARMAIEPGSAVLGRMVAHFLAHAGVLAIGLLLLRAGIARRRATFVIAAVAAQFQVALSVLRRKPTIDELESTGLSFAVNVLLPWLSGRRVALSDLVIDLPGTAVGAGLVGLALVVAYIGAALLATSAVWLIRLQRYRLGSARRGRGRWLPTGRSAAWYAAPAGVVVLVSVSLAVLSQPVGTTFRVASAPPQALAAPDLPSDAALNQAPEPVSKVVVDVEGTPERAEKPLPRARRTPRKVEIQGSGYRYSYLVDGVPKVIRGMGLNTQYTRQLTPTERIERLHADFAMLRSMGFNTVLGWEEEEFDETLLDVADQHDLGVILPFALDPKAHYADPVVRTALMERVRARVERYRHHPALRMWGLGNEVLHKIVHPAWVGMQDPQRDRDAHAFADWLLEAADAIHALDPVHPVTYRSAEDAYTRWVAAALKRRGGGHRPWFVWGVNCYQAHLETLIANWPTHGIDAALWVSEFAPGGMAVPERPEGFRQMWGYIQNNPSRVLGGAVYAWTRNGPEEIDRTFGLTDDGKPVDGRSLATLAELFGGSLPRGAHDISR